MENTEETRLEGLKEFFKEDANLKQTMMDLAPTVEDIQSEEAKIEYTDRVEDVLKSTKLEIQSIFRKLGVGIDNQIDDFFNKKMIELANCLRTPNGIKDFYKKSISNMDIAFVEEVKKEVVGYYLADGFLQQEISKTNTINELLHLLHSYVVNNDELIKTMPVIDKKKVFATKFIQKFQEEGKEVPDSYGVDITLYGEENETARAIFEKFPNDTKAGFVDIISLENKVFMMARDLGHALTIEIDTSEQKPLVKYFVPKICNRDMVEKLPGIGKITENGANGMFEVQDLNELPSYIFKFMDKVPTDENIYVKEELQELASTRKISDIKSLIGTIKGKIVKKDTIEKDRL